MSQESVAEVVSVPAMNKSCKVEASESSENVIKYIAYLIIYLFKFCLVHLLCLRKSLMSVTCTV